ncbi:UDP-N-acetyl-D-mannosamine 6-dehydrogenase [Periconia macrospinosa]|uniref:UDP-N-acetyl-D-mannosamine 6-dehydrogenase n=1 Tax=Periconia macrospinosa TaxID=97972 RepID=A0A2V1DPZ8_9PLEO|nr:UDP-N-acetyl-D-mannosamine 6-dehydrogenase [Periconia macrospinosa]
MTAIRRFRDCPVVPKVHGGKYREHTINIENVEPCVCVIGVGFVGETLLREFGRVFKSIGFDISQKRIRELEKSFQDFPNVILTTDKRVIGQATHFLISVPTPLKERSINLTPLLSAIETTLSCARPGSAIVLESSVCVGTTRKCLASYKDIYHCGMSPERVDPGRFNPPAKEIPKIVSGLTPKAAEVIKRLYSQVFNQVVLVSSPETAEITKLFENCQRMINIAYVNEMADAARSHGVNPEEMIAAASSKPYGFMPYSTGLGVGGTCIPINPFYLFTNNKNLPVLEKATTQMWKRPGAKARMFHARVSAMLKDRAPRILVVGLAYKSGQSLLECSPGVAFAKKLKSMGCSRLAYYDPLVRSEAISWVEKIHDRMWCATHLEKGFDAIAVCMRQEGIDFGVLEEIRGDKVFIEEFT